MQTLPATDFSKGFWEACTSTQQIGAKPYDL